MSYDDGLSLYTLCDFVFAFSIVLQFCIQKNYAVKYSEMLLLYFELMAINLDAVFYL